MPVSEHEETGVKPVTQQSSNYIAGIPIKKRRFPIIRSPSPPCENPLLLSVESSLEKEQSLQSPVSTCPNLAAVPSSSKLSDTNKNPEVEVRREISDIKNDKVITDNANYAEAVEPSLTVQMSYLDGSNKNVKIELTENVTPPLISRKNELNMPSNQSFEVVLGNNVEMNQKAEMKVKTKVSAQLKNDEPFLSVDKNLVPFLGSENSDKCCQNQESSDSISLNLSLSEERCSTFCKSDDKLNIDNSHLCADRANWDLNMAMDAWDGGSGNYVTYGQMSVDGNKTGATLDVKSMACTAGIDNTEKHAASLTGDVTKSTISSVSPSQQNKSDDSLHLHLSPSLPQSSMNHGLSWDKPIFTGTLPKVSISTRNLNAAANLRTVKSEPVVDSIKLDPKGANAHNLQLLKNRGKEELLECRNVEPVYESSTCTSQLLGIRSIKPELSFDANKGMIKLEKSFLQLNNRTAQNTDDYPCVVTPSVAPEVARSAGKSVCGKELSVRDDSDHYKQYTQTCQAQHNISSENKRSISKDTDATLFEVNGKEDVETAVGYGFNHPVSCKLDVGNNSVLHSSKNSDGTVSDQEMINISGDMLEEDSYGSDFESDVNHAAEDMAFDTEQDGGDDYEDGEVREPPKSACIEESMPEKGKVDQIVSGNCDVKKLESMALVCNADSNTAYVKEKSHRTENTAEKINPNKNEISDAVCLDESDVVSDKNVCFPETVAVEKPSSEAVLSELGKATQRSIDYLGSKDFRKYQETVLQSKQNTNECEETVTAKFQGTETNVDTIELVQNEDVSKGVGDGDNALKDSSGGSHRSRIIHLPRSSTSSSPGKTRSISGRLLPSRVARDGLLNEDKKQYRGRNKIYFDDNPKFARERCQDGSPRNSRWNFIRGRGRIDSQLNSLGGDRGSDRDFASEFCNGPAEFHVRRRKYSSFVSNGDLEYSSYDNGQDARFIGADRAGRRSRGGSHGNNMDRRIPRNMSPGRYISENGSQFVGQRRGGKIFRGFPGDTIDPMFSHSQQSYEGEDGRFGCGNRVFSSDHRRGPPRIRSKSPISSRPRSPGPWSAPGRRLPEGFGRHSDLTHRRSPPFYLMNRTRSPDRPCFPQEMAVRRHDMRDNESGQNHSHPRSVIPSRSPSGQLTIRNRRYNVIDDQERPDGDDYFGPSLHSSRSHELNGEGISDDHRRFRDRRGPIRTYRPPYNCADDENFHLKPEDDPRPLRFCPEDDREFQERGNSRDREFERRIKNRSGNVRRRIRSIGEDPNYRHDELDWHEDGFDDISRLKRKRF